MIPSGRSYARCLPNEQQGDVLQTPAYSLFNELALQSWSSIHLTVPIDPGCILDCEHDNTVSLQTSYGDALLRLTTSLAGCRILTHDMGRLPPRGKEGTAALK